MSGLASLKKYWYWVVLVVLSALIATAAVVAPGKISQIELEREALIAADRLKAQMLKEPDTLFYALSSPSATPQFAEILDKSGYSHRVLRYELYDQTDGQSISPAASPVCSSTTSSRLCSRDPRAKRPRSRSIRARTVPSRPISPSLTLPLAVNGEPRGTLVVYLDQSDQANVLVQLFRIDRRHHACSCSAPASPCPPPSPGCADASGDKPRSRCAISRSTTPSPASPIARRSSRASPRPSAACTRDRTHIAVLCLDIDKFKEINDAADHAGGDQVLRDIGAPHPVDACARAT